MPVPQSSCSFTKCTMHASAIDGHSIRAGQIQEDDVVTFSGHELTRDVLAIGESEPAGLPGRPKERIQGRRPPREVAASASGWCIFSVRSTPGRGRKRTFNASQERINDEVAVEQSYPVHKPIAHSLVACPSINSAGLSSTPSQCSEKPRMRTSRAHLAGLTDGLGRQA